VAWLEALEQAFLQDVAAVGRARADDQLALVAAQRFQPRHAGGDHAQRHARRLGAQPLHQSRQQQVTLEVVGRDRDAGLPARRVEQAAAREAFDLAQQLARLRRQRFGMGGCDDAAARLDEQRVLRDRAQLVELVADRRLRHVQRLCRAGDAAGLHHRDQQLQQAHIEVRPIESVHAIYDD